MSTEEYINMDDVAAAIALYNHVRAILEERGWRLALTSRPGYWWVRDDREGMFSMEAAFLAAMREDENTKDENAKKELERLRGIW